MTDSPRVIIADDLFKFRWLQDARFSPDGKQVLYVVSHIVEKDEKKERKEESPQGYDGQETSTCIFIGKGGGGVFHTRSV